MVRELENLVSIDTLLLFSHLLIFTSKCSFQTWHPALRVKYHICYSVQISLFSRHVGKAGPCSLMGFMPYKCQWEEGRTTWHVEVQVQVQLQVQVQEQVRVHLEHVCFELRHVHCTSITWSHTFQLIFRYNCKLLKFNSDNSHGIRICIKRKKIHYGKFFDFCAEKCVYN